MKQLRQTQRFFCHAEKKNLMHTTALNKAPRYESLPWHSTGAVKKFKIDVRAAG
jgi:hypothetical protein